MIKFFINLFKQKNKITTIIDGDLEIIIDRKKGTFTVNSPRTVEADELETLLRKYV